MINIEDLRAIKELSNYIFNVENGWRAIQLNSNVAELIDTDDVKDAEKSLEDFMDSHKCLPLIGSKINLYDEESNLPEKRLVLEITDYSLEVDPDGYMIIVVSVGIR